MWKVVLVAGLCWALTGLASSRQVCYYDSMAETREGPKDFKVSDVNLNKCTHLIYAFADINEQCELVSNPADDIPSYMELYRLKIRNPQLKTLLAVGGPNFDTHKFSKVLKSYQNRAMFIQSTIRLLRSFHFDGLDLTWWYPGGAGGQRKYKKSFTALCEELKQAFEADGVAKKDSLILTVTISAEKAKIDTCYDMKQIATTLDFINVLMFDLHESWEGITRHHSPLNQGPKDTGDDTYQNIVNYIQRKEYGRAFVWSLDKGDFSGQFCDHGSYPFINHLHTLLLLNVSDPGKQHSTRCLSVPSFCKKISDGDYANSLTPNCYYSCVGHITYVRRCPANQIFVQDLNRCERNIKYTTTTTTSATKTTPTMTTRYQDQCHSYPSFCNKKSDGDYANSLNPNCYYSCSGHITYVRRCPANLVFDQVLIRCERKIKDVTTTTTTATKTTPTMTTRYQDQCHSYPSFCNKKSDGDYANSLNPNCYYSCSGHITYVRRCPANLIFDQVLIRCERKIKDVTTTTTTATKTTPTMTTRYQDQCHSYPSFCNKKSDGDYANSLNPNCYYSCSGHITYVRRCPANLVFDQVLIRCERKIKDVTTTTTTATKTTPTMTTRYQDQCHSYPSFCNKKSDGDYANSLNPNCYYSCSGHITYVRRCPANLVFDQVLIRCERKIKDMTTTTTTATKTTPTMTTRYQDQCHSYPSFCNKKSDGDYANSLNPNCYYSCSGHITYVRRCPANLVFDQVLIRCERKIKDMTTTTTTATKTTPTMTTRYQDRCYSNPFFCKKISDGYFANSVSPNCYYCCVGHITYVRRCPANFIFVEGSATCKRKIKSMTTTHQLKSSNPCAGKSGLYPDPNDRKYFFQCDHGKAYHRACAPGTVFDETCHCCNFP